MANARTSGLAGQRSVRYLSPKAFCVAHPGCSKPSLSLCRKTVQAFVRIPRVAAASQSSPSGSPGEAARARLQQQAVEEIRVGPEEHGATFEVPHPPGGVVREDVPAGVVGGREGELLDPRAVLDVVQDGVEPFAGEVGREREHG